MAMTTVEQLMTRDVRTCLPEDSLARAAQIMWEHDCGCVPIVTPQGFIRGIITDRDCCMGAYIQGRALHDIQVHGVMSRNVFTVAASSTVQDAAQVMQDRQLRRLPVVDDKGRLVGILSICDVARQAGNAGKGKVKSTVKPDEVALTLHAISLKRDPSSLHV